MRETVDRLEATVAEVPYEIGQRTHHHRRRPASVQNEHTRGTGCAPDSGPSAVATATCTAVADRAATIGYRIDSGGNAGKGWVAWVQYRRELAGATATCSMSGRSTTCPPPVPPRKARRRRASSRSGRARSPTGAWSRPTRHQWPDLDRRRPAARRRPFAVFAGLNGPDARSGTLAITREGGPAPVLSAPMTFGAGGLDAVAQVPALDAGSYVATFTLERADGSTATTVSGFRVVGAKRIRDHDEVNCRRLSEGRHACTLGLIRASTGTGA